MLPAERVQKATGLRLFWYTIWARAYPRIIGSTREKSWLFFETVLPLMGTASYVFVYRAIGAPEAYTGFVVLGGAMTAFWLNVLWAMASQLYWDKDGGNLELYVVSPGPLMAILLGMAVGGILMTATRAVIILGVCSFLFNVSYQIASLPLLILIFVATMAALYGMGMMFASIFLAAGREAWHISNLLQEPIYLASGFYFPVKAMGFWIATFASVIPLTLGLDAMRQLIFAGDPTLGFLSVEVELIILLVLSVVFIYGAIKMLAKLEEIGRREGRLIERRR
ncbi:MAG: ABC transporter permease [Chloroflexi bacterium]|jgi:ABC-2 type transport system permease protein|nr:ABC transporter permease [Chloroflexota bacterium]MDL1883237.1 ABC transporter permease [Anaerolineae bacterium CFX8]